MELAIRAGGFCDSLWLGLWAKVINAKFMNAATTVIVTMWILCFILFLAGVQSYRSFEFKSTSIVICVSVPFDTVTVCFTFLEIICGPPGTGVVGLD